MSEYEHKPYLVQRLNTRAVPHEEADSVFRYFEPDHMGAAEFERGILGEALVQACKEVSIPRKPSMVWGIETIHVGPDIVVRYVGPEERFPSAVKFLQTQLIEDGTDRYMAERPLKEVTCLRQAYLCLEDWCAKYCGWWCLDIEDQFAFFKKLEDAELFLKVLHSTNWRKLQ